jgi:hypothetical protein
VGHLVIQGELADQLRALAESEQCSVEALLQRYIDQFPSTDAPVATLRDLAESLAAATFHYGRSDTATRSREILEDRCP